MSAIWLNGFTKIESQRTHLNVEQIREALANDLEELNSTARDWAGWDDTYVFVENVNERYIQENLGEAVFANLRLNIMLFINRAGQIRYGKSIDLQQKVVVPVPESLKQYLATHRHLLQHRTPDSHYAGIVMLPVGPVLIASQPILKNDRTGPIRGTLLLGRFLNPAQVRRFSELTRLSITIYPFEQASLPHDFQVVRNPLVENAPNLKRQEYFPILVHPLSSKRIAGYTLLRDIKGQPGLLLRVDSSRDIYQQGKQGLRYLVVALIVVGLAFGGVTLLLLEKSVLSPLARFSAAVRQIRAKGDLKERLSVKGRDELSRLGTAINQLLETLQQSQLQLGQSEEKYRSVVNNVTEVIFKTDITGRWTFLNPAWTEITGFSVEESLGQPCWTFIHPDDQLYHLEQFRQLIDGESQNRHYEIRFQTCDGRDRTFEIHLSSTIGGSEEIVGTAGTLNDITERKLAEAKVQAKTQELEKTLLELTQTQAQLIQSEKMSSLGQLVAGVAHEINNPISFVYGNISYVREYMQNLLNLIDCYQKHYPNPPDTIQTEIEAIDFNFILDDLPKVLDSMNIGAERICEIVQSLKNFSRMHEAEIKTVDIHEGLKSTLLILKHKLKAEENYSAIKLIEEYGKLPLVQCYPGQLNQVLMNLLVNAIDALQERRINKSRDSSQPSPFIRIYTEVKQDDSSSCAQGDAAKALIRIADNGTGMTEEVRRRLFDPFFTTKPIGKGTGLGLSISYRIVVEAHKGQLLVNSEFGQGSEFIIELPIRQSR